MAPKSLFIGGLAGLAILASAASAQVIGGGGMSMNMDEPSSMRVGPIYEATYNANTGVLTRHKDQKSAGAFPIYVDTDTTGFFGVGAAGAFNDEWLDWHVQAANPAAVEDIVVSFQFGYATLVVDPLSGGPGAQFGVRFYDGAVGLANDSAAPNLYSGDLAGLPGHNGNTAFGTGWLITVSLTGGSEFELPAGPTGFGVSQGDTDGFGLGFSPTGPLNVQAGDGTGGVDLNGNVDFFSVWSPSVNTAGGLVGNTFGFGASDHAAWYLVVNKADFSQSPATVVSDNPGGSNPSSYSIAGVDPDGTPNGGEPVMGGTVTLAVNASGTTGHTNSTILGYLSASTSTLGGGQVLLINVADVNGEILQLGLAGGDLNIPGAPVPIDVTLCGLTLVTQGVHLGTVTPFALSNRHSITTGGS